MRKFNNLHRMLRTAAVLAVAGLATFTGCTKVDDTLGANLVPDNQQMKAGYVSLPDIKKENVRQYVETRLFRTDSIIGSNISYGYMGAMLNDTLGLRTAGFLSQYISYYLVDSGYFGFRPFMDSVQILLSIKSYGKDTTSDQTFGVYEVISNNYLTEKPIAPGKSQRDSTFYLNFDPSNVQPGNLNILGPQLFTFSIGKTYNNGPSTKAFTMTPTAAGEKFVDRLMLKDKTDKNKYSIYSSDSLEYWVKEFKGLYIKPESAPDMGKGTVYSTSLDASGFAIYGRNHVKDDPTLIKDTIGMVYYFYDSYAKYGNVSVNSVKYDYAQAPNPIPGIEQAGETNLNRPEASTVYVSGMGGVISEITFTQEFFDDIEKLIDDENKASAKNFKTLAFSQVRMSIYFDGSDYDWQKIDPTKPGKLVDRMNVSQKRLGLYTDYKKLTPIIDYAYVYENSYSTELAYGGYINRSRSCYTMDITGYMQGLWNSYMKLKASTPDGEPVDMSKLDKRSVYLGPEAYDLFTPLYSVAQGMAGTVNGGTENNAPIRFDLTYNMIK